MKNKNFDPRLVALAAARFHHGSTDHHDHPHGHQGRGGNGFGPGFGRGFGAGFPGGFGPEMMRDFAQAWGGHGRARKGDVRAAILSLLSEAPATGYALIKGIAERTDEAVGLVSRLGRRWRHGGGDFLQPVDARHAPGKRVLREPFDAEALSRGDVLDA